MPALFAKGVDDGVKLSGYCHVWQRWKGREGMGRNLYIKEKFLNFWRVVSCWAMIHDGRLAKSRDA
jgi:hypothetical protein